MTRRNLLGLLLTAPFVSQSTDEALLECLEVVKNIPMSPVSGLAYMDGQAFVFTEDAIYRYVYCAVTIEGRP